MKFESLIELLIGLSFLTPLMMLAGAEEVTPDILGGRNATFGDYPWFAAGLGCGGTLIYEDIVLTAAHCNYDDAFAFDEYVQIGGIKSPRFFRREELDGEVINAKCVVNHPDYVYPSTNDIALVKLVRPSTITSFMQLNFDLTIPVENQTVVAIGHGVSGYGERIPGNNTPTKFLPILQVLQPTYVQPQANCEMGSSGYNASYHICVDVPDSDAQTCAGDSGGPIFTESSRIQVGLSSFGPRYNITEECDGSKPDYFTNVAKYQLFVEEGICSLSANPPANCPAALPAAPAKCLAPSPSPPVPTPSAPVPTPNRPTVPTPVAAPPPSTGGMMQGMIGGGGEGKGMSGGGGTGMSGGGGGKGTGGGTGMTGGTGMNGGTGKGGGTKSGMAKSSKDPPKAPKMTKKGMMGDSSVRNRYLK